MDMSILKYMAFVKTIECGSFTKAAELLNYSQSGISRMISDLEKEWGITLIERNKSGIKLTSDGTKLLPYAQNLCSAFDKLKMQVDELNGLHSGLIRIGTISSIATHLLPDIIKVFQNDYPNIDYELLLGHYADIEKWVSEGRVDIGFTRVPPKEDLEWELLKKDNLLVVLPENHSLAGAEQFPISALADSPFMLLEKNEKADISAVLDTYNIKPNIRFTTVDDYAVMSMVEKGLGISILPQLILQRIPYKIIAKPLDVDAYRELGYIVKNKKTISSAVRRFLDYIDFN